MALKIYYKSILSTTKAIEREGSKAYEIQLPSSAFKILQSALDTSNRLLPVSARQFQAWRVGLLER